MEKKYSSEVPVKVEQGERRNRLVLNYDVREATEDEILVAWRAQGMNNEELGDVPTSQFVSEHKYVYNSVEVPMGQWKYDGVVNAIVREKYRSDEMEAIANNMAAVNAVFMQKLVSGGILDAVAYLKESANSDDTRVFEEMQEWRALAKKEAKEVFGK